MIACSSCQRPFDSAAEGLNPHTKRHFLTCPGCRAAGYVKGTGRERPAPGFTVAQRQARLTLLEELGEEWKICPNNGLYTKSLAARLSDERFELAKCLAKGS